MSTRKTFILLISGPSGAGKGSIYKPLMARDSRLRFSISCTTRAPRPDEVDGEDYHFLTHEEFRRQIETGAFAEHATVHEQLYGTRRADLASMMEAGLIPVLDIDVQGGEQILDAYGDHVASVFIFPPSWAELERRLRGRATENEDKILTRLKNARWEVDYAQRYRYWIVNELVDEAVGQFEAIIAAEGVRRVRWGASPLAD